MLKGLTLTYLMNYEWIFLSPNRVDKKKKKKWKMSRHSVSLAGASVKSVWNVCERDGIRFEYDEIR